MTKYELFKKIADELTPLILNLEKDINAALAGASQQKVNTSANYGKNLKRGLGNLARSIFTKESSENLINLYQNRKNSLYDYQKLEYKIEQIYNDIIDESLINENSSKVAELLLSFKQKFSDAIKNIANELQVDYDKEKAEYMKQHGSSAPPDSTPDSEIEQAHNQKRSLSYIDQTLEEFSELSDQEKYEALIEMYAVMNYKGDEQSYSDLSPLLKKIIDENKYKEAKNLLPIELQKKLDEEIRSVEQ